MISSVVLLAVLAVAAWAFWRRGARGIGFVIGLCAFVLGVGILRQLPWPAYLAAAAIGLVVGWHRYARSAGVVTRFAARTRRGAGVASMSEIRRHASVAAMRRRAGIMRPSLAGLTRRQRRQVAAPEVAVQLCRSGLMRVWAAIEDVVLVFGGPRSGKTGWMAGRVIDHPGAAVVTSTRTDLLTLCSPSRALGQLAAGGLLEPAEARSEVLAAADRLVSGPCDCTAAEIAATVRSGLAYGARRPRELPTQRNADREPSSAQADSVRSDRDADGARGTGARVEAARAAVTDIDEDVDAAVDAGLLASKAALGVDEASDDAGLAR